LVGSVSNLNTGKRLLDPFYIGSKWQGIPTGFVATTWLSLVFFAAILDGFGEENWTNQLPMVDASAGASELLSLPPFYKHHCLEKSQNKIVNRKPESKQLGIFSKLGGTGRHRF
jgi:hypothetical protein